MSQKVLVVDDDNSTRVLLATILADAGYETIAVSTLQTAVQAITDEAPDAVIADVRLAGSNGMQLLVMNPRPIPFVMVTGLSDPAIEREARQMGAEYLLKPVLPSTLVGVLRRKLAHSPEGASSPPRQWARKQLTVRLDALVGDSPARILDVSYGGLRLEIERVPGDWLSLACTVSVPASDVAIPVNVVWKRRSGHSSWLCGAAVPEPHRPEWQKVVDTIP